MKYKEEEKIRVLHVVHDEKFFEGVLKNFDSDELFINECILITSSKDYVFKYIKSKKRVKLLWNSLMVKQYLEMEPYDVLYFHSISPITYKYFKFIPKNKIVVWWGWGYDLYGTLRGMPPLLPINVYLPLTERYLKKSCRQILKRLSGRILRSHYEKMRATVIQRVDFFQPVIPVEWQLLKEIKEFEAKEFYSPNSFSSYQHNDSRIVHPEEGSILFGNSANITNNHLDAWQAVEEYIPSNRKVIMPLNYGDMKYAEYVRKNITGSGHFVVSIDDFMPRDDYFSLVDNCSYAIYGSMRQQGMGNVYHCLTKNIKVFLFKDSIIYKYLKQYGYCVYAIEDANKESFVTPLSNEESKCNAQAFENEFKYRSEMRERAIQSIKSTLIS